MKFSKDPEWESNMAFVVYKPSGVLGGNRLKTCTFRGKILAGMFSMFEIFSFLCWNRHLPISRRIFMLLMVVLCDRSVLVLVLAMQERFHNQRTVQGPPEGARGQELLLRVLRQELQVRAKL